MDFRQAPAPETLAWQPPRGAGKTKTATATFAGKKIVVQTPECAARAFKNAGSTTLYLALDRSNDVHAAFATWIETLESYALTTHRDAFANLAMSTSVRDNGSFRLMVWDDAQWFDQGAFFKDGAPETIAAGQGASCIVEFVGCWSTDATWGLKWRVVQVQLGGIGETQKTPARAPVATIKYAFADDD